MQHHPKKKRLDTQVRASPAILTMRPCALQLDEEKSKHTGLAQQNALTEHFCKVS
jgi:hypothetical protein